MRATTDKEKAAMKEIRENETIVDWDPNFKLPTSRMTINGEQFENWTREVVPELNELKVISGVTREKLETHGRKVGDCYLVRQKFPTHHMCTPGFLSFRKKAWRERSDLPVYMAGKPRSWVCFDRPVALPVFKDPKHLDRPWMSLTPNEVLTQRPGICRGRGRVMIAGMGFGWFARQILARKQVEHVTIVDTNQDILDTFGPRLKEEHRGRVPPAET